ncbi:MAG: DUF4410 domain-containing protein [Gammaproteobacteria bacterium]|nr:DUF4410 domain-containing protein [Gammaproteobacteria bacterium]
MFKNLILIIVVAVITGCGTASTVVLDPVEQRSELKGVTISSGNHNVEVPQKIVTQLQTGIEKGLYEENDFIKSDALLLEYKFLQQDEGNQFVRWFFGGIGNAGEASLTVLVTYTDVGNQLAQTQVQGKIDSGFFWWFV